MRSFNARQVLESIDDRDIIQAAVDSGALSNLTHLGTLPSDEMRLFKRDVAHAMYVAQLTSDKAVLDKAVRDSRLSVREAAITNPNASREQVLLCAERASRRSSGDQSSVLKAAFEVLPAEDSVDVLLDDGVTGSHFVNGAHDSLMGLALRISQVESEEKQIDLLTRLASSEFGPARTTLVRTFLGRRSTPAPIGVIRAVQGMVDDGEVLSVAILRLLFHDPSGVTADDIRRFLPEPESLRQLMDNVHAEGLRVSPEQLDALGEVGLDLRLLVPHLDPEVTPVDTVRKLIEGTELDFSNFKTTDFRSLEFYLAHARYSMQFSTVGNWDVETWTAVRDFMVRFTKFAAKSSYMPTADSIITAFLSAKVESVQAFPESFLNDLVQESRGLFLAATTEGVSYLEGKSHFRPSVETLKTLRLDLRMVAARARIGEDFSSAEQDTVVEASDIIGPDWVDQPEFVNVVFRVHFGSNVEAWRTGFSMLSEAANDAADDRMTLVELAETVCALVGIEPEVYSPDVPDVDATTEEEVTPPEVEVVDELGSEDESDTDSDPVDVSEAPDETSAEAPEVPEDTEDDPDASEDVSAPVGSGVAQFVLF